MSISRFDDTGEGDDVPDASAALTVRIDDRHAGERLDKALAQLIPDVSRSRLQQWVGAGAVSVNGHTVKARHTLAFDDVVEIKPQPAADAAAYAPEPMPLDVVFEDDAILVLNKPPKLVVHPAAGHWSGTLLNGLLAYVPALSEVPRAGIVHRLDADTSGLMVVAKTLVAQTDLVRQIQARTVAREYWALVLGVPAPRGTIDAAIGRDPRNPLRFKVSTHARITHGSIRRVMPAPKFHGWRAGWKRVERIKSACTLSILAIRSLAILCIGADCRHAANKGRSGRHSIDRRCTHAG